METPLFQQSIDGKGFIIRPFSDFLDYLKSHIVPKGSVILFKDSIPSKGWDEVTDLTPPAGYIYGVKI